ncbi:MAG: hypothetical protein FWD53_04435 [Phycisphaerales bacterium]|nr:hypothetical protein [Phycisphaerales bacterium]
MLRIVLFAIVAVVMAGCQGGAKEGREEVAVAGPFYVPATLISDRGTGGVPTEGQESRIDWFAILPEGDTIEFPIGRTEKFAYGPTYRQYGIFTVYTHDRQRISRSGWRFTNSIQNWSSIP